MPVRIVVEDGESILQALARLEIKVRIAYRCRLPKRSVAYFEKSSSRERTRAFIRLENARRTTHFALIGWRYGATNRHQSWRNLLGETDAVREFNWNRRTVARTTAKRKYKEREEMERKLRCITTTRLSSRSLDVLAFPEER